jgi:hypothetical protein
MWVSNFVRNFLNRANALGQCQTCKEAICGSELEAWLRVEQNWIEE